MNMPINDNLADLVTIGIATKNRWQDLQITLKKLSEAGLESLTVIVFDDCSDEPCPFDLSEFPLKLKLKRFLESQGYITRRNHLAKVSQTKYYLSLDDDSFPVQGSLSAAIEFAESRDEIFCLSFPIYNPVLKEDQNSSLKTEPYQVRSFVGCGHLLHLSRFTQLGGYREELVHQGEEMEIAARAFKQGWYCYHFPQFKIHHSASNAGRNWHRMDFYGARNNLLWNDWFMPNSLKPIKQLRTTISRLSLAVRVRRMGQLQGIIEGLKAIPQYQQYRQPMSSEIYRAWNRLPHS
jgi:GT2 family glycosyltransferase